MARIGLGISLVLLLVSESALAGPKVSADDLARLAGLTSEKTPEIQRARQIARDYEVDVATYGGISRELIDFVKRGVAERGGVIGYERWLETQRSVSLLDWHRIASDLDLMLVRRERTPLTEARKAQLTALQKILIESFPGSAFYSKLDFNVADVFAEKFDPRKEHYEPISNIALTEKGILDLEWLKVARSASGYAPLDLGREGLRQYAQGTLDFWIADDFFANPKLMQDTYGNLRQVLRWIRYASEHPELKLTPRANQAIETLFAHVLRSDAGKAMALLKEGNAELIGKTKPRTQGGKLVSALEKLQLYSKDSIHTAELLQRYGIASLAERADIVAQRILTPLPDIPPPAKTPAKLSDKRLGREITLYHRSSLAAVQNMADGALWISNDLSIIQGKRTVAGLGPGLYAASLEGALAYGDAYMKITLSAEAIEGIDYLVSKDRYVILSRRAIARDPFGSLKLERINKETFLRSSLATLAPHAQPASDAYSNYESSLDYESRESALRSIATLLQPEHDPSDQRRFLELLPRLDHGELETFLTEHYRMHGDLRNFINSTSAYAQAFRKILNPQTPLAAFYELRQYLVRDALKHPELVKTSPLLAQELTGLRKELKKRDVSRIRLWHFAKAIASDAAAMRGLRAISPVEWERAIEFLSFTSELDAVSFDLNDPEERTFFNDQVSRWTLERLKNRSGDLAHMPQTMARLAAESPRVKAYLVSLLSLPRQSPDWNSLIWAHDSGFDLTHLFAEHADTMKREFPKFALSLFQTQSPNGGFARQNHSTTSISDFLYHHYSEYTFSNGDFVRSLRYVLTVDGVRAQPFLLTQFFYSERVPKDALNQIGIAYLNQMPSVDDLLELERRMEFTGGFWDFKREALSRIRSPEDFLRLCDSTAKTFQHSFDPANDKSAMKDQVRYHGHRQRLLLETYPHFLALHPSPEQLHAYRRIVHEAHSEIMKFSRLLDVLPPALPAIPDDWGSDHPSRPLHRELMECLETSVRSALTH